MSKYNMYTKGGGLNPAYVEELCHQHDLDQFISDSKYIASELGPNSDGHVIDKELFLEIYEFIKDDVLEEYDIHEDTYYENLQKKHSYKELGRLEGQMMFLDEYAGDEEKLRLAKLLLGIKE